MLDGPALVEHLGRQRWYGGPVGAPVDDVRWQEVRPGLFQVVVLVGGERWQLLVGVRPAGQVECPADAVIGPVTGPVTGPGGAVGGGAGAVAFDALADPGLCRELLAVVAPGESATTVRALGVEQSNSSLVYDDRLFCKVFRRLQPGPNPDVEVPVALARVGFDGVADTVGRWFVDGHDCAVVQRYLPGGVDGWTMATSQLSTFPPEAGRLGELTARLHLALAAAFGVGQGGVDDWVDAMLVQLTRFTRESPADRPALVGAEDVFERVRRAPQVGASIRVHGDYHLGQVVQSQGLWFALDFEGEPARPLDERRRPASPYKDVAGMLRSFGYAAAYGGPGGEPAAEAACREAFLGGYLGTPGIDELLPAPAARQDVQRAFELDKAVYELRYERAYRPDWAHIPLAAIARLLGPA